MRFIYFIAFVLLGISLFVIFSLHTFFLQSAQITSWLMDKINWGIDKILTAIIIHKSTN